MNTERNCQTCKYFKDGYCENLELKPHYPMVGCDYFEPLDVLDKIFDEICDIDDDIVFNPDSLECKRYVRLIKVMEIIDKYRGNVDEI